MFIYIIVYSVYCVNYLLDLNPGFISILIRNNSIPILVRQTQNIEFIDVLENSIKVIEKISKDRPMSLVENDAFQAILMFIDFFDLNLRVSSFYKFITEMRGKCLS